MEPRLWLRWGNSWRTISRSILRLLMPWLFASLAYQQPRFSLGRINRQKNPAWRECYFTRRAHELDPLHMFEDYTFKIINVSPRANELICLYVVCTSGTVVQWVEVTAVDWVSWGHRGCLRIPWTHGWIQPINGVRPEQNGCLIADNILNCLFLKENFWISNKISLKYMFLMH